MKLLAANSFELPERVITNCSEILMEYNINTLDLIPHKIIHTKLSSDIRESLENLNTKALLDNEHIGFITISWANQFDLSLQHSIVLNAAIFSLINSIFFEGAKDNATVPFDLYKSTVENTGTMVKAGIKFYSPDQKLGYHNDVYFDGNKYYIPKYVSLLNLFIGYDDPGNFYYINNHIWSSFKNVFSNGVGKKYKFRPTPSLLESDLPKYENELNVHSEQKWTEVFPFWRDSNGNQYAFCNGELNDIEENNRSIEEMKSSLLNNEKKFYTQQGLNKIMIFRNDIGYHSRDIFKEQQIFEGVTRLFIRSVSKESMNVPTID